jgi:hypothetical protein
VASERHAAASPTTQTLRSVGRSGRHGRPSAIRAAIHARLEEMRFEHGVLLMGAAAIVLLVAVTGVALALTGGSDGHRPNRDEQPQAATSSDPDPSRSSAPTPRDSSRRPRTSSSTVLGSSSPRPVVPPSASPTPSGPPSWWPTGDPRFRTGYPRWHRSSPPPWWHHH